MLSPAAARHIEFAALSTKHAAATVELVGAYRHLQEQFVMKDTKLVEITREHEDAINKKEESKAIGHCCILHSLPTRMSVQYATPPTTCMSRLSFSSHSPRPCIRFTSPSQ